MRVVVPIEPKLLRSRLTEKLVLRLPENGIQMIPRDLLDIETLGNAHGNRV